MSREQAQVFPLKDEGALPRIGVVGVGAVGTTLAWGLAARGYPVAAVMSRTPAAAAWLANRLPGCQVASSPAEVAALAEVILLTVPDDALADVAALIPWHSGLAAIHCSGATPARALAIAGEQGALFGSFHPLLSIPHSRPASAEEALGRLAGCTFAIEAPVSLTATLEEMAHRLGARAIVLREQDRVPYHLAAVLTSNYLVTLVSAATDLWAQFGVSREQALAALSPLLRSALVNLEQLGLPQSLTGPIARGDVGTVRAHLDYLADPKETPLEEATLLDEAYRALGLLSLPIAIEKGRLEQEQAASLKRLLTDDGS
ncbi:MAG TPA: DUF2520 domain-containing protein [Ktedonobacterales bacterium]|nr:DUF2520 domain-containing protein [Ktedonobacterales bacterium]